MKILIIIPCYNEANNILQVYRNLKKLPYDIIVINDGSTDSTYDICIQNKIPVINLSSNLGIGGAVQTGYLFAFQNGYDFAIQFDGDGQHDASYLDKLLSKAKEGFGLVIGSRFLVATDGFRSTFARRIGIKFFTSLIYILTRQKVTDSTSGFRIANREVISIFSNTYPSDYPEPESIVQLLSMGIEIAEIPAMMKERAHGVSSISSIKSIYYMIKVSVAIIFAKFANFKNSKTGKGD